MYVPVCTNKKGNRLVIYYTSRVCFVVISEMEQWVHGVGEQHLKASLPGKVGGDVVNVTVIQ